MRLIDADEFEVISWSAQGQRGDYARGYDDGIQFMAEKIDKAPTIEAEPVINAVWQYYMNDEGKARWRCGNCGRICRRDPHDKLRCSTCGAHMTKEA